VSRDNVQPRHLEAARLYLAGPTGVRNNWPEACKRVGFKRVPGLKSKVIQKALVKEGANIDTVPDSDMVQLEQMLAGDPTWEELSRVSRKVMVKIGTGVIQANAGQVTALKETIARAEGRVGQDKDEKEEEVIGVVVLPAIVGEGDLRIVDVELGQEL